MKLLTLFCFVLFVMGVLLGLAQLWLELWNPQTFFKIIVTDGALFAICLVAAFLIREGRESDNISRGSKLD